MEFYGFLENVFVKKLKPNLEETMKQRLASAFEYEVTDQDYAKMADVVINRHARCEVAKIIHYMTGTARTTRHTHHTPHAPPHAPKVTNIMRGWDRSAPGRRQDGRAVPKARSGQVLRSPLPRRQCHRDHPLQAGSHRYILLFFLRSARVVCRVSCVVRR
jgi:hypothetical protein